MKASRTRPSSRRYLSLLLVVMAIASCLFVIQATARYGFSKLLITYSLTAGNLTAAEEAIQTTPKDPEAHVAGAALLAAFGTSDQALVELERAVALRPSDYELWSQLGLLRDQTGDTAGALQAFAESIKRAPFYSEPRWNRGNVLLRSGQYEAAFNDLNQAAQSNPELMPTLIDLAWGIARGDLQLTEQLAQINSGEKRIAFARLLARRGKAKEAVAEFGGAGNVPEAIKRELVEQLLAKGAFREAFEIWQVDHGAAGRKAGPSIYDGGFEGPLSLAESGFGWRVPRDLQATVISPNSSQPQSGTKCLSVEFGGNSNPGSILISQIILVEPTRRYKVNFASRSQDLVTGGLPLLVVSDASGDQERLGQSPPLSKGTSDWQQSSFGFTTTPTTMAVVLSLARENCTTSPCPVFGSISLDSFSLEELK